MLGGMADVTHLLAAIERGDPDAAGRLWPLVYDELRRLAGAQMARERAGHSLDATALVHEAYLRLTGEAGAGFASRRHFFFAAARAMRQILVENARAKGRAKGQRSAAGAPDLMPSPPAGREDVLALHDALEGRRPPDQGPARGTPVLRRPDPDQAADCLTSPSTADRAWRYARFVSAAMAGDESEKVTPDTFRPLPPDGVVTLPSWATIVGQSHRLLRPEGIRCFAKLVTVRSMLVLQRGGIRRRCLNFDFDDFYGRKIRPLKPDHAKFLDDKVVPLLENDRGAIWLQGSASRVGANAWNMETSMVRAGRVQAHLLDRGASSDQIQADAVGEMLAAAHAPDEDRDRSVRLWVFPKFKYDPPPPRRVPPRPKGSRHFKLAMVTSLSFSHLKDLKKLSKLSKVLKAKPGIGVSVDAIAFIIWEGERPELHYLYVGIGAGAG